MRSLLTVVAWLTGGQKGEIEVEVDRDDDEAQFCLEDYESGDEDSGAKGSPGGDTLSPAVVALMKKCV